MSFEYKQGISVWLRESSAFCCAISGQLSVIKATDEDLNVSYTAYR